MEPTRRQSAFALRPFGIGVSKNAIVLCNDFGFIGSGIYTVKINGVYSVKRISLKNTDSYIMACDNKLYEPSPLRAYALKSQPMTRN